MFSEAQRRAAGLWNPWKLPARLPTWKSLRDSHSFHRSHRLDDDDSLQTQSGNYPHTRVTHVPSLKCYLSARLLPDSRTRALP